ncbi:MAG TPA: Holliday junction resolvase RuvX [Candidatus Micrarchaeaceae archaeon]|nr:Holliday junction resolvase RuvX [Candidatus Micrarchaeaceae archaeon]
MKSRPVHAPSARESSSGSPAEPRRILAVDYGTKRIGLAISDDLLSTARPLQVVPRTNRRDLFKSLRKICSEHAVARILVGHPLHLSGDASPMAEEAARFAARLEKELNIPVELCDERLTSWEAGQIAREAKLSSRRKSAHLDDVAAALLLREYLDRKRGSLAASTPGEA